MRRHRPAAQKGFQVHPGGEAAAGSGEDRHLDVIAPVDLVARVGDRQRHGRVHRVAGFRAVDRDGSNAFGHLEQDFGHGRCFLSAAACGLRRRGGSFRR